MSFFVENHHDKTAHATGKDDTISYDGVIDQTSASKTNKRIAIEVVSFIVTVGLVWLVLLIPIIVYHLPDEVFLSQVSTLAEPYGSWYESF